MKKPVVLIVLDGWGIEAASQHNGVHLAQTPCFDALARNYPYTELHASGEHVGLPDGQMGNSEVGHTTIGAGTVIYQDLVRIGKEIRDGDFSTNPALQEAFDHTNQHGSQLHIIGLFSPGGVHAHEEHFMATLEAAKAAGVERVILHPILDGRDTATNASFASLQKLEDIAAKVGAPIASLCGRYYAMDRDKNWDRTDKAFTAIWKGEAVEVGNQKPSEIVKVKHAAGISDELMEPVVFRDTSNAPYSVQKNDAVIFTNFRTDRTRQLSSRICELIEEYNLCFVTMTDYGNAITSVVAYEPQTIEATLAGTVAAAGLMQAHIAETEKFPHATYFLNGGKEEPHTGEEHTMIPSRNDIKTHDEAPEMRAKEIADAATQRLKTNDFLFINFANPDMVGHTANQSAIITAVETVDRELQRVVDATLAVDGQLLIIADHGNAERMVDPETGLPHTSHTTSLVPCILVSQSRKSATLRTQAGLKDVAPTVLELLNLEKPASMTGISLLQS